MKKRFLIFTGLLVLSLTGCAKDNTESTENTENTEVSEATIQDEIGRAHV